MIMKLIKNIVIICCVLLLTSCTSPSTQSRIPGPAVVNVKADLMLNLPNETAAELKIPSKMKGALRVTVEAEALEEDTCRSRFSGKINLTITDTESNREYLSFETSAEGEADGSPREGITEAFTRFFSAVGLMAKPMDAFSPPHKKEP